MPSRVVIASICPWSASIERPHFHPQTQFSVAAIKRGDKPAITVIEDQVQWYKVLSTKPPIKETIFAREIANDFILHTSRQGPWMSDEAHPGIWICEGDEPTAEEIAESMAKHAAYCNLVVQEADEWHMRRMAGEPRVPKHTQRMKDAARWLLLDRPWLSEMTPNALKQCQFCTATIPSATVKCPTCGEVVDKDRYAEMKKGVPLAAPVKPELAGAAR